MQSSLNRQKIPISARFPCLHSEPFSLVLTPPLLLHLNRACSSTSAMNIPAYAHALACPIPAPSACVYSLGPSPLSYSKVLDLRSTCVDLTTQSTRSALRPAASSLFLSTSGALDVGTDGYKATTSTVNKWVPIGCSPIEFNNSTFLRRSGVSIIKEAAFSSTGLVTASISLPSPSQLLPVPATISLRGGMTLPGGICLCVLGFPYSLAGVGVAGIAFSASFSPT